MIRLLADENFNENIVRGIRRRSPDIDLVRVRDVGLSGADDPTLLEWAAQHERILLTHDVSTITAFAYERVRAKAHDVRLRDRSHGGTALGNRGYPALGNLQRRWGMGRPGSVFAVAVILGSTKCGCGVLP